MSPFRGSDEALEREIAAVEQIAKVRVHRAAADLRELERDLRELKRERARRRAGDPTESESVRTAATAD